MTRLRRYHLYLVLVSCGAVVMAIEILGARLVAPHFGLGLYAWSALIAVTLLALAFGYGLGGVIADRFPRESFLDGVIATAGVTTFPIPFLAASVIGLCQPLGLKWGTLLTSWLLLGLPLMVLAMILPFAVRLEARRPERLGTTTGRLYALSTFGSVLGTLGTAFLLIPTYGVRRIFLFASCWLVLLAIVGMVLGKWSRRGIILIAFLLVDGLTAVLSPGFDLSRNDGGAKLVFHKESPYSELKVVDRGAQRYLLSNNILQTAMNRGGLFLTRGSLIWSRNYMELLPYFNPRGRTALVIGLGGGLVPMVLAKHDIEVQSVEVDPDVIAVAREYFGFEGEVYAADGRYFLAQGESHRDDFVIIDAFSAETIPFHLLTREMFHTVRETLTAVGILCVHYIGPPDGVVSRSLARTLLTAFDHIRVYQSAAGNGVQSLYFFASNAPLILERKPDLMRQNGFTGDEEVDIDWRTGIVYTDDYNPVDVQNAIVTTEWRRLSGW